MVFTPRNPSEVIRSRISPIGINVIYLGMQRVSFVTMERFRHKAMQESCVIPAVNAQHDFWIPILVEARRQ
jgi:hypothetical protein